jgi:hypothetical protein
MRRSLRTDSGRREKTDARTRLEDGKKVGKGTGNRLLSTVAARVAALPKVRHGKVRQPERPPAAPPPPIGVWGAARHGERLKSRCGKLGFDLATSRCSRARASG